MSEPFNQRVFEQRELHGRRQLVHSGLVLPVATARERFGVNPEVMSQLLLKRRVLTVDVDSEQYVPAFYLSAELDRRKLEDVAQLLGDVSGWSKYQFFTTPKASLNGLTPLDALKRGMVEEVKDAATAFTGP